MKWPMRTMILLCFAIVASSINVGCHRHKRVPPETVQFYIPGVAPVTVRGLILDLVTGEPIPSATVTVWDEGPGANATGLTDESGGFSIPFRRSIRADVPYRDYATYYAADEYVGTGLSVAVVKEEYLGYYRQVGTLPIEVQTIEMDSIEMTRQPRRWSDLLMEAGLPPSASTKNLEKMGFRVEDEETEVKVFVSGMVRDALTEQPLPSVSIQAPSWYGCERPEVFTSQDGMFNIEITLPANHTRIVTDDGQVVLDTVLCWGTACGWM